MRARVNTSKMSMRASCQCGPVPMWVSAKFWPVPMRVSCQCGTVPFQVSAKAGQLPMRAIAQGGQRQCEPESI
jgi:hypothetical protein